MQGRNVVIDAARIIRHYLDDLVGERSDEFDREIAKHLQASGEGMDVAGPLLELFESNEATREWLAEFLDDPEHLPPEYQAVRSGEYSAIPGKGNVMPPPSWVCPVDQNFVVYQHRGSDPIPLCREHQVALVLVV